MGGIVSLLVIVLIVVIYKKKHPDPVEVPEAIECPSCGVLIDPSLDVCPSCSYSFSEGVRLKDFAKIEEIEDVEIIEEAAEEIASDVMAEIPDDVMTEIPDIKIDHMDEI